MSLSFYDHFAHKYVCCAKRIEKYSKSKISHNSNNSFSGKNYKDSNKKTYYFSLKEGYVTNPMHYMLDGKLFSGTTDFKTNIANLFKIDKVIIDYFSNNLDGAYLNSNHVNTYDLGKYSCELGNYFRNRIYKRQGFLIDFKFLSSKTPSFDFTNFKY